MKAVLELELIGDDMYEVMRARDRSRYPKRLPLRKEIDLIIFGQKQLRPWVAHIAGLDERFGFKREFIRYQTKDYSRANSVGSRGVYVYYTLGDGLYEVNERVSWKRSDRYFIRVEGGQIKRMSKDEVLAWLQSAG